MIIHKYIKFWGIAFLAFLLVHCSTEKNTIVHRTYHNLTAHYNGYWNAREIMRETNEQFQEAYVEDYSEILPVYMYPDEEESKAFKPNMDTAIKKCLYVIYKHRMPNKKVGRYKKTEWCEWIDDNNMAIGEAKFYKRDFTGALKKFKKVENLYDTEPIIYEAMVWQAKTYIELEDFVSAKSTLEELETNLEDQAEEIEEAKKKEKEAKKKEKKKKPTRRGSNKRRKKSSSKTTEESDEPPLIPEDITEILYPTLADYYLRKKEYDKAEEYLNKSIEVAEDRQFKTRLIFILAQLKHKQSSPEARELYSLVVKRNPKYDMAFNAKLNKALSYAGGNANGVRGELKAMLRDKKNKDYLDQIYYALADIEIRDNNIKKGKEYLASSINFSTTNTEQKGKSFLRLGKIYYDEKSYINAQKYYDSTLTSLNKTHPEYELIEEQNVSLTDLVQNLNLAERQDSLLRLCKLPEKELTDVVYALIEKEEEQIRLNEEAEQEAALKPIAMEDAPAGGGKGNFWAYNSKVRDDGFTDFKEVWGTRTNIDNWRREDKGSFETIETEAENDPVIVTNPKLTPDYYLKDLPCNSEAKKSAAEEDVVNGLYNAAGIYRLKLDDEDAAISTFERMEAYLPNEKSIESLYQLYIIYGLRGNKEKETYYKNKILQDYSDSEYATLIKNPKYAEEQSDAAKAEEREYERIYSLFTKGNYNEAASESDKRLAIENNPYQCKYLYLKAMSVSYGNTDENDLSKIESALQDVVDKCDDPEIKNISIAALDRIRNKQSVINAKSGDSKYIYNSDGKHFFVLIFPNDAGSVNKTKNKISDFNRVSFSLQQLTIKNSFIDADNQIITVKSFADKKAAMDYYDSFKLNKSQVQGINEKFDYFVITAKNFATLFVDKDINEYLEFFGKNYP